MYPDVSEPKWNGRVARFLRLLRTPRTIVLAIAIVYFIAMAVRVVRWYQEFGQGRIIVYPEHLLVVPFWLIVAAVLLLVRKWWSELLAVLVNGRVLYMGFVDLRGNPFVSDLDPSYRIPL